MKTITSIVLGLGLSFSALAQNHQPQSFLPSGVDFIVVTNTLQVTNLNYILSNGSNRVGTVYGQLGVTNVAAAGNYNNLLGDVNLWADRMGQPYSLAPSNTISSTLFTTPAAVVVCTRANSGANAAISLVFAPVYNDNIPGINVSGATGSAQETTGTTDQWTMSITPTASSTQVFKSDVPMYRWPGAKKLRLLYVSNADTDASSDVTISHISLNGFVP